MTMKGDFVLENNTSRPAPETQSQGVPEKRMEHNAEPYVGMPIYLDDNFFQFVSEDIELDCIMEDDMKPGIGTKPDNGSNNKPGGTKPDTGTQKPGGSMPDMGTQKPGGSMPDMGTQKPGGSMPDMGTQKPGGSKPDMGAQKPTDCVNGCPVAMAYVPWQMWEETYEPEEGFSVGTIFPCLDLPFLGGAGK